jgi:hypothetical protein
MLPAAPARQVLRSDGMRANVFVGAGPWCVSAGL